MARLLLRIIESTKKPLKSGRGIKLKFLFNLIVIYFMSGGERDMSGKRDLNPRPSPWQGDALPLSYSRNKLKRAIDKLVEEVSQSSIF